MRHRVSVAHHAPQWKRRAHLREVLAAKPATTSQCARGLRPLDPKSGSVARRGRATDEGVRSAAPVWLHTDAVAADAGSGPPVATLRGAMCTAQDHRRAFGAGSMAGSMRADVRQEVRNVDAMLAAVGRGA